MAPPNPAGRHRPADQVAEDPPVEKPAKENKRAREAAGEVAGEAVGEPADAPIDAPVAESAEAQGQHADGQSFADLMQRLQIDRTAKGGRRRRKED